MESVKKTSLPKLERQITFAEKVQVAEVKAGEAEKLDGQTENVPPQPTVDTNYDPWSRGPESSSITTRRKPGEKIVMRRFVKSQPNVLLDRYGAKFGRPETACSSVCQHPWLPRTKLRADEIRAQKIQGELSLLRAQIKVAQKHLAEMEERRDILLDMNVKEQSGIMENESEVHKEVYNLIVKYGKFRGAAESAQKLFEIQKEELMKEVEETRVLVGEKIRIIRVEDKDMDLKIIEAKNRLNILLTYKEDAFFKNNAEIAQLERELSLMGEKHEKHVADILQVMDIEREKMRLERRESEMKMVAETADEFMDDVHQSWKEMADDNSLIRYNIEKLKLEVRLLESETKHLQRDIKERLQKPTANVRTVLYPELYRKQTICQPDDDVILDIPKQKTTILF